MKGKETAPKRGNEEYLQEMFETLKCPVCLELYDTPIALPCLHNFCKACLEQAIGNKDSLDCPVCRYRYNDITMKNLKVNWTVKNSVETLKKCTTKPCPNCQIAEVSVHCKECASHLCEECNRKIHDNPILQQHQRFVVLASDSEGDGPEIPVSTAEGFEPDDVIVDFVVPVSDCLKKLKEWEASLWFAPGDMKRCQNLRLLVPYWVFEVETSSKYTAEGSIVARSREWQAAYLKFTDIHVGRYRHAVCASTNEILAGVNKIEPWALDDLRSTISPNELEVENLPEKIGGIIRNRLVVLNFVGSAKGAWVRGRTERGEVGDGEDQKSAVEEVVYRKAKEACEKAMRAKVGPHGAYRNFSVTTTTTRVATQRVYFPVYISWYVHNKTLYQVLVNGQTGHIYGEHPYTSVAGKVVSFTTTLAGIFGMGAR